MYYVIRDREQNLPYDNYFYATFFNPETLDYFEELYGTTSFTSSPLRVADLGGKITHRVNGEPNIIEFTCDTPHEVRALYDRVVLVRGRLAHRKEMKRMAEDLGLNNYHEASRLLRAFPDWADRFDLRAISRLLKTKKFRSPFRESLAKQVREWVKEKTPKYAKPLSPKQLAYIE